MKKSAVRSCLAFVLAAFAFFLLASAAPVAQAQKPLPPNDRARGLVYDGLEVSSTGECVGGYKVKGPGQPSDKVHCTPGPDAAPPNLDVQKRVAPVNKGTAPATGTGTSTTLATAGAVTCDGDGVSGKRVQVIYAHAADVPSQYATYLTSFQQWAAEVDAEFQTSAAHTGGTRHVRYVTDANCLPVVADVQVSVTGDDTFDNTIRDLKALGWNRTDRKYMVFMDARVYCGIGDIATDDKAGSSNKNNSGPDFGRTDSGCWSGVIPAHELMHNFGGVQLSAPHSDLSYHCYDGYDNLCDHSGQGSLVVCADPAGDSLFDCNHDDYYNTNPPAGSYLATHWNTANSQFLIIGPDLNTASKTDRIDSMKTGKGQKNNFTANSTFTPGSAVGVRAHAADQSGASLGGVNVSFTVNRPDGSTQCSLAASTDSNGNVLDSCSLPKNAPVGSWSVHIVTFGKSGYTSDTASSVVHTPFTVQ